MGTTVHRSLLWLGLGGLVVATVLMMLLPAVALGQVTTTLQPPSSPRFVELEPRADGGVRMTVHARAEDSTTEVALDKPVTCESGELTAAQRTALGTIRTAALGCWRSKAVDGGL